MSLDLGVIISTVGLILASVIGYLLSRRDTANEANITDLYKKVAELIAQQHRLEVKIAEEHYPKEEVNRIIDGMKSYLDEKFQEIRQTLAGVGRAK